MFFVFTAPRPSYNFMEGKPIPEPGEVGEGDLDDAAMRLRALQDELYGRRRAKLTRKIRLQMQIELLMLKKRRESESGEKDRLEMLRKKLREARDDANQNGRMPEWVKQVNQYVGSSRTLRLKIGQQQSTNPDELSFRFVAPFLFAFRFYFSLITTLNTQHPQ